MKKNMIMFTMSASGVRIRFSNKILSRSSNFVLPSASETA